MAKQCSKEHCDKMKRPSPDHIKINDWLHAHESEKLMMIMLVTQHATSWQGRWHEDAETCMSDFQDRFVREW